MPIIADHVLNVHGGRIVNAIGMLKKIKNKNMDIIWQLVHLHDR